jgi:glycosyltransferase involved in cell wall biosynthesis
MTQRPLVSVIVTVYNREKYIGACLDSILASTWTDHEVIIVDDLSSDNSATIAEEYAARDRRVQVHRNTVNLGDYPNRLRGAELSSGRYLKYVDSDDIIYPHGLAVMVEAMESAPRAALGVSHSLPEDAQPYPWLLSPQESWRKEFLGDGCMGSGPTGAIIRRDAFFEAGGFRKWGVLSDTDLWYRMSARWDLLLLPPGLVWWRRHDSQEFTKKGAFLTYLRDGYSLSTTALQSAQCPLSNGDRDAAIKRTKHRYARKLLALGIKGGAPAQSFRLARHAGLSVLDVLHGFTPYR